jgi:hypothetical protein
VESKQAKLGESMTERMVEDLHSDVCGIAKSDFRVYTPEEAVKAWREADKVLDGFCQVADGLSHAPLILALVDAKVRAEEELERARDRSERPEGVDVSPREDERLKAMLERLDALGNTLVTIEDHPCPSKRAQLQMLEVLGELKREADEAFDRYKLEIGLPE